MQLSKPIQSLILSALCLLSHPGLYGQSVLIQQEKQKLATAKDSSAYVDHLNRIGLLYHLKNPDSCFSYGFKAKAIASRIQYIKGEADADNNIAIALYLKGLYSESLTLFGKIIPTYRLQTDTVAVVNVWMNMSTVYLQIKDPVKAVAFCRKAVYYGQHLHNDSCMSVVYANYAIVNQKLSEDSLKYYLTKSEKIANRYNDRRMLVVLDQLKAYHLLDKGRNDEALPLIKRSLLATRASGMEYLEINSLDLYATYYASKPDSVLAYYSQIYKLVDTKGFNYLKVRVLNVLLQYDEKAGYKDKQAVISQLLITSLAAENENMKKFIGDYVKYNALQSDNRQLVTADKNNQIKIGVLLAVCVIISLLIILIYRLYKISRKHEQQQLQLISQVQEQNQEMQRADEFKNMLISILAHDFRTPLISTIGIARLMKESQDLTVAEMTKFYDNIENEAQTMLQSFDIILQWIKQQLSGYQYKAESIDLHQLFAEAVTIFSNQQEMKKLIINIFIPENTFVVSDREMLQFVNRNLLSNAMRFSPEFGTIKVNAAYTEDELIVSVEDSGPGMSASTIDKLFSVSGQFGLSTQHGAGIALSMCRDFIQKLGGRIWATNKESNGAVFFYAIPIQPIK